MQDIDQLVKEENHLGILKLKDAKYNPYKCVALIKLGEFENAKKYCEKDSFEYAYILYAQKKYKKCLKSLSNQSEKEKKVKLLKSQALYNLGRYNEAYSILSGISIEDEVIVNLSAMQGMALLAHYTHTNIPTEFTVEKRDEIAKFVDMKKFTLKNAELQEEAVYNCSFRYLFDIEKFLKELKEKEGEFNGGCISRQIKNVEGRFSEIEVAQLTKSEIETLQFNKREIAFFKKPMHFQRNFDKNFRKSAFGYFKELFNRDYDFTEVIPNKSESLILLNAFVNLKRMFKNQKFTRRYFQTSSQNILWEVVRMLATKKAEIDKKELLDLVGRISSLDKN